MFRAIIPGLAALVMLSAIGVMAQVEDNGHILEFAEVLPCDTDNTETLCINRVAEAGSFVTMLMEKSAKLCHAKTGRRTSVYTQVESFLGTRLIEIDCKDPEVYITAVLSFQKGAVKDYKKLQFHEINDIELISRLDAIIVQKGYFDIKKAEQIYERQPVIYKYPYPNREVYFIKYKAVPGPIFLFNNGKISSLSSESNECAGLKKVFKLNNHYFAELTVCTCETDACGPRYIAIDDKSYRSP